jgi:coproporphyrinogen III oxidase-like Fe-S oxidoreductase
MSHKGPGLFRDRKTECWTYPGISRYRNAWDGGRYLNFLASVPDDGASLRIYLHVPFCKHLCTFCPYYKKPYDGVPAAERLAFVRAVGAELAMYARLPWIANRELSSIYFGGGDPAVLTVEEHVVLWEALRSLFSWSDRVQVSLEGTATSLLENGKLGFFREQGVDRVSFGIQTFDTRVRKQVNLRPTIDEIGAAAESIVAAGISDASVDMIYNFPGQNESGLRTDLELVRALPVTYIDFYSLSLYPSTTYMGRVLEGRYGSRPTPDSEVRLCRLVHEEMAAAGYAQVSAVTFSGRRNRPHRGFEHTLSGDPSLGVGPSARSWLGGRNYRNQSSLEGYVRAVQRGDFPVEAGTVASVEEREDWPYVFFPVALRRTESSLGSVPRHGKTIDDLIERGYVRRGAGHIELTAEGRVWVGNIQRLFFSNNELRREREAMFEALRGHVNPYNEDRMGISARRVVAHG